MLKRVCGCEMIIIGHKLIASEILYKIKNVDSIAKTLPNSTVLVKFSTENFKIFNFCKKHSVEFAVEVKNLTQIALVNFFNPKYILVKKKLSLDAQKFADDYLIDAKILFISSSYDEIEFVAKNCIDGIIFRGSD